MEGNIWIASAVSDIAAQSIEIARLSNVWQCLIGQTSRLRKVLDFDQQGAGWGAGQELYVEMITGNLVSTRGRFADLHSIQLDGDGVDALAVDVRGMNDQDIETVAMDEEDGSYFVRINRYGVRHKLRFTFPVTDETRREIRKLGIAYSGTPRQI